MIIISYLIAPNCSVQNHCYISPFAVCSPTQRVLYIMQATTQLVFISLSLILAVNAGVSFSLLIKY